MARPYLAAIRSIAVTVGVSWFIGCEAAGPTRTGGRSNVSSGCAVVAAGATVVEIVVSVYLHVL
jgi:hypothetical protein